jgi:formamidopyrimidine-DNA glycosylase
MPELAEVEFYRKQWDSGLRKKILSVHWHPSARVFRGLPEGLTPADLTGARLLASQAHGKQILFQLSTHWLGVHLGMTGELSVAAANHQPGPHDHLVLRQNGHCLVFRDPRRFGRIRLDHGKNPPAWWSALPPGLLEPGFSVERVAEGLRRHARSPLKATLLRQELFPGIGNWMADEILWRLQWSPARTGQTLTPKEIQALHRTVRHLARQALRIIGTDWSDPPDNWLFQHRWKDGGFCPRDGTELLRAELGGRTTCWCPVCQVEGGKSRKRTSRTSGKSKARRTAAAATA